MTADVFLAETDDPTYSHFAHREAFCELLDRFLQVDVSRSPVKGEDEEEEGLVRDLGAILDHYLPLPGLLDPYVDQILPPLMDILARQVIALNDGTNLPNADRLNRLGRVINWVIKVRGWKAIVQHFPSTISYLPPLISVLSPPTTPSSSSTPLTAQHPLIASDEAWETRAVLLLWLALLLTVPFSLSALSSSDTPSSITYGIDLHASSLLFSQTTSPLAQRVILLSLPLLHRSGKEGAYAALVLARIFSRTDAVQGLQGFLNWAGTELAEGEREGEANFVASILELLALLPSMLPTGHSDILERFMDDTLIPHLRGSRTAATSGLIRKLVVKAKGRWWMTRMKGSMEEEGMPEGLEEVLDDLMTGLADKDTIVRYSSAKYLARLTAVLPEDFADQSVLATIALFEGTENEPVVETPHGTILDPGGSASGGTMGFGGGETNRGEARWHGVCLALAEMARRGLVRDEAVGGAVRWVLKALTFDIRRATHSIGSNVRDAASYVLWSLSRACPPALLRPHADAMATSMICAACFDREVGVRRAASAAFQEGVGRLGLYPEGIDVLAKSDFYSVSVRRIAYTVAAPAIAAHDVYRSKMREHLHNITMRHWDEAMRSLGAVALRDLVKLGGEVDLNNAIEREIPKLHSLDSNNVHGALSALTQVAGLLSGDDPRRHTIFFALSTIRPSALTSPQAAPILKTACEVICATLNDAILSDEGSQRILDQFIEGSTRRREVDCQEAVADVYAVLSGFRDCWKEVIKLIGDLQAIRAVQRQAAALCLGHVRYSRCPDVLSRVVTALLAPLGEGTKADVETRRYTIRSLGDIVVQSTQDHPLLDRAQLENIVSALTTALADYSTDQRGDVGSWIRVASLNALGGIIAHLSNSRLSQSNKESVNMNLPVSQEHFEGVIAGLVKLLVEKLEPVRAAAGRTWGMMRLAEAEKVWAWEEGDLIHIDLQEPYEETFRYIDQKEWFARVMPILQTKYRRGMIDGLVLCMGSQIGSVSDMAFYPFRTFMLSQSAEPGHLLVCILEDILGVMERNYGSNRVFIPCLISMTKIIRSGLLSEQPSKLCADIVRLGCKGIKGIKSIERITAILGLVIAALGLKGAVEDGVADHLGSFLKHRFPRIRSMCAEQLYLASSELQNELDPELEELLLETTWTDDGVTEQAGAVVDLIKRDLSGQ